MKIKRLRIQNFQSIKDITFKFDERGVFYFNGDNNIGKSSVLKAIRALFFNVSNLNYKDYIRDDETFFSVTMEDYEGNFVILSRGASDFYKWKINGESGVLNKTSGQVPKELRDYFNLYQDEKTKECANIRPPRAVLMGVDTSEGDNNLFLQKALNSSGFTKAYKQADTDRRAKQKDIKLIENYVSKTEMDIENVNIDEVEDALSKVQRFESVLLTEKEMYMKLIETKNIYNNLNQYEEELDRLSKVSTKDMLGLNKDVSEYNLMVELNTSMKEKKELEVRLKELGVRGVKTNLIEANKLKDEVILLKGLKQSQERSKYYNKQLEDMSIDSCDELMKESAELLDEIVSLRRLRKSIRELSLYTESLKDKEDDLKVIFSEIKGVKEELGVCPLCGSELNGDGHKH